MSNNEKPLTSIRMRLIPCRNKYRTTKLSENFANLVLILRVKNYAGNMPATHLKMFLNYTVQRKTKTNLSWRTDQSMCFQNEGKTLAIRIESIHSQA